MHINSNPPGAKLSIFDQDGNAVAVKTTPASVRLRRDHGYFSGEKYKLVFEEPGYYPTETFLDARLNPIYFGNLLFGGAVGFLAVDPLAGAMWTFPNEVNWNLVSSSASLNPAELKQGQSKANSRNP